MWISGSARAFLATILAYGLALGCPSTNLAAATLNSSGSITSVDPIDRNGASAEPFGLFASELTEGGLRDKWSGVLRELDDEMLVLALCQENRQPCASAPAERFLAIVDQAKARDGRARLGEINRAINLAIKPVSDLVQYGRADVWSSPLETFAAGAGDCEDYAIAKFVALQVSGIAAGDLRLVILRDTLRQEDHAVVAARLEGRWLILDNRRMAMVEDLQLQHYRPTFVIDRDGVREYQPAPQFFVERWPDLNPAPAQRAAASSEINFSSN